MPASDFTGFAANDRAAVDGRCAELVDELASHHEVVHEAVRYVLLGGKRLRALLCLWCHDLAGGRAREAALDVACAIECIHAYSLVHDDLPCMDDDDLRRGKPSCHVRFGEATAVLTGDTLLNLAYEIVATVPARHRGVADAALLEVTRVLSFAAGTGGLITGQMLDLAAPDTLPRVLETVDRVHENKTARLIAAAMESGAVLAGAGGTTRVAVREAGLLAGRAFQIVDDILDVEKDQETLGKTPGKDIRDGKLTYPALAGLDASRLCARELADRAKALLADVGESGALQAAVDFIVERGA